MAVPVPMTLLQVQYIEQGDSVYKVLVPRAIEELDDPDIIVEDDFRSVNPIICQVQNAKQFQRDCSQDQSEKPILTSFIDLSSRFNAVKSLVKLKVKQDSHGKKQVLPDTRRFQSSALSEILDDDVVELDKDDVVELGSLNQDNSAPRDVSGISSDITVISPTIRQNPKQDPASRVGNLPMLPSKDKIVLQLTPLTQSMNSAGQHETSNDVMEIHSAVGKKVILVNRCPNPVLKDKEGMVLNPPRRMPSKLEIKTAAPQKQAASKLLSPRQTYSPSLVNTSNISYQKRSLPEVKPPKTTTSKQRNIGGWLSILSKTKSYPDVSLTAVVQPDVSVSPKSQGITPLNSAVSSLDKKLVLNSAMANVQPKIVLNSIPKNIAAIKNLPYSVDPCSKNTMSENSACSTDQCMKEKGHVICDLSDSNEASMFTIGPVWSLAEELEAVLNIPGPSPRIVPETKTLVSTNNVSHLKPPGQFLCPEKPTNFLNIQVSSPFIEPKAKAIVSTNNDSQSKPPRQLLCQEKPTNSIRSSLVKETICSLPASQSSVKSYSTFNNVNLQTVFKVQDVIGNIPPTVSSKLKRLSNENKTPVIVQTNSDTNIQKKSTTISNQSSYSNSPESPATSVKKKRVCSKIFFGAQMGANIAVNNSKTYTRETTIMPIDVVHHNQDVNLEIPFNKSPSTAAKLEGQQQITIASQDPAKVEPQFPTNLVNEFPKSTLRPKIAIVAPLPSEKQMDYLPKNQEKATKTIQNTPWNKITTNTVEKPSINIVDKIAKILNENYEGKPSRIIGEQKISMQTPKIVNHGSATNKPCLFRVEGKSSTESLQTSSLHKNTLQNTIATLKSSFAKTSRANVVSNKFPLPPSKENINDLHTRLKNASNDSSRYHAIEKSSMMPDIKLEPSCPENNIVESAVQETSERSHDPEFASDEITRTHQIIISNICSLNNLGDKSKRTNATLSFQKTTDPSNSNVSSEKSHKDKHNMENMNKSNLLSDRVNRNEKKLGLSNILPSACREKQKLNSCAYTSDIDSIGKWNFGKKSNALPDRVSLNPFPNWNPDPVSSWDPQYVINVKTERESDEDPDNCSSTTSSESDSSTSYTGDECKKTEMKNVKPYVNRTRQHMNLTMPRSNASPSSTDDECKKIEMTLTMARLKSKSKRNFIGRNTTYNENTYFSESNDYLFQGSAPSKSTIITRSQNPTDNASTSSATNESNYISSMLEPKVKSHLLAQSANASVTPQSQASILHQPKKSNIQLQPHSINESSESLSSSSSSSVSETSLSESETERYIRNKHAKCRFQHIFNHEKAKEMSPVSESSSIPVLQPQTKNASVSTSTEQRTRDFSPHYLGKFKIPKVKLKSHNATCSQNASLDSELDKTRIYPEPMNRVVETQSRSSSRIEPKTDANKSDSTKLASPSTLFHERTPIPKPVIKSTLAGIKIDKPTSEQHVSTSGQVKPLPAVSKRTGLVILLSESQEFLSNNITKLNVATRTSYNSLSSGQIRSSTVSKNPCSEPKPGKRQTSNVMDKKTDAKFPKRPEIKLNSESKLILNRSDSYISKPVQTSACVPKHSVPKKVLPVKKAVRKNNEEWSLLQVVKPCFVRLERLGQSSVISSSEYGSPPKLSVISPLRSTKSKKTRKRKRKSVISRQKLVKRARFGNPEIASPTGKCIVFSPESSSNDDSDRFTEKSLGLENETVPMHVKYCASNRIDNEKHQDSEFNRVHVIEGALENDKLQGHYPGSCDSRESTGTNDDADLASKHASLLKLLEEKSKLLDSYRRKFGGL